MHVSVGGIPANDDVSTDVWQYRQSIPRPRTWCSWLNGTGCVADHADLRLVGRANDQVRQDHQAEERTPPPKMLTRDRVLALGWKICTITHSARYAVAASRHPVIEADLRRH